MKKLPCEKFKNVKYDLNTQKCCFGGDQDGLQKKIQSQKDIYKREDLERYKVGKLNT